MAYRHSTNRHFSVPAEQPPSAARRHVYDRQKTWDIGDEQEGRRRSSSQHRYSDVTGTACELRQTVHERFRSAQEIFNDCFSTSTELNQQQTGGGTDEADPQRRSVDTAKLNNREGLTQTTTGNEVMVVRRSQSHASQERKVRSLVLDTRYNRLLLVKSKMTETEALKNDIVRTNSLPAARRRSRFQYMYISFLFLN